MLQTIYAQPVVWMIVEILGIPILWNRLSALSSKRSWVNLLAQSALLILSLSMIVYTTLLARTPGNSHSTDYRMPFALVRAAVSENREIFRSLFLNVLLFEPLGATLVHLLPGKQPHWRRILTATLVGLAVSLGIEYCQFRFSVGNAEADDVICNTLGALVGALSCLFPKRNTGAKNA